MAKCVLAFSGGLDTLVAIAWLKERRNFDVVALAVNLGQGEDLEELGETALRAGAISARVEDLRENIFPRLHRQCAPRRWHITNRIICWRRRSRAVDRARTGARGSGRRRDACGARCSGKGNDQVRFEAESPRWLQI